MSIKELQPEGLWKNFYALTQVPRPSGHLDRVRQFLLSFANEIGVEAFVDSAGNVVMRKSATLGYENRKGIILQAHMDMVPQKELTSPHNFESDAIESIVEGDWVRANGTTLGSDDGMGVAAIMAVLAADDLQHGPIEGLFTVDEETNMIGANNIPADELHGDILLNLDTEDEGVMVIGSAGGIDVTAALQYKDAAPAADDVALRITVKGLQGGHSGLQIGLERANANKLLARVVLALIRDDEAQLASWHCGDMRNAIPFEGNVVVTLPKENVDDVLAALHDWETAFNDIYAGIESGIKVVAENVALPAAVVPEEIQDNLVNAINACHDGVLRYIPSLPDIVETSSNLAIINIGEGCAEVKILARSASEEQKEYIASILASTFAMAGMKVSTSGDYPGWDPNPQSEMIHVMEQVYEQEFGKKPEVTVVHAGLECSIILSKYPHLDIVSFGPTLVSPHTAKEKCQISSTPKFWTLLTKTLAAVPAK